MDDPRLLVIVPVLARPQRVQPLIEAFANGDPRVDLLFVATDDDADELAELDLAGADYLTLPAALESWARKINLAFRERVLPAGYEWSLLGADDIAPRAGWYDAVLEQHAESDCCVIGTNDGHNSAVLAGHHSTHPVVNRDYWACGTIDEQNLVCHEGYRHWYVDAELVETAQARGTYAHAHEAFVEHFHPLYCGAEMDDTYRLGQSFIGEDRRLFMRRRRLWGSTRGRRVVHS